MYVIITEQDDSPYKDKTGEEYHFPNNTYLARLNQGDWVIYYKGKQRSGIDNKNRLSKKQHYFGVGKVASIVPDPADPDEKSIAFIENFTPFSKAVPFKIDKQHLEDVRHSNHFMGGNSVRKTTKEVFDRIIELAGVNVEGLDIGKSLMNNKLLGMEDSVIQLLKYKHQVILQGPPGTGKTRMAKLIAERLIQPTVVGNPVEIIDDFFQYFNPDDEKVKKEREHKEKLLASFHEKFPKEKLKELTLEDYCIGTGDNDSFCWWLESGLKPLGYYFPGTSRSYLIYWNKADGKYSKHGQLIKDIESDEEAMKSVANYLHEIIVNNSVSKESAYFGSSFLLKILNTYYPEKYFPINSKKFLDNILKLFSIESEGMSVFQKNEKLNELWKEKKAQFGKDVTNYEFSDFLTSNFNLKEGEDIDTNRKLVTKGGYQLIQFHPAYSYEDFVRGIIAETSESGNISYQVENKILASFAVSALENPNGNYVLIIDEINRANLSAVLGELIYALEYRGEAVKSMYSFKGEREIVLPNNLFILGTMNTADRSVGHIDYALRRRFAFVEVLPEESVIEHPKAKDLFKEVSALFTDECLAPDFHANDVKVGHSYFLVKDENELRIRLEYEIKPILREYLKDGVLLETAKDKIEQLAV